MRDFWDETVFVERLRALDDDVLLLRLRVVEQAPDAYRPGVQEAVKAEVARRGLSVAWAAPRPEPRGAIPTPGDVARGNMLAGALFLVVSALATEILRSTGWYDDAQLVGGPLATLGCVLLLKGFVQHSRDPPAAADGSRKRRRPTTTASRPSSGLRPARQCRR